MEFRQMKKVCSLILFLLIIFCSLSFLVINVSAAPDLIVVSSTYWPDKALPWYYYLTGEVENIGDSPAGYVWVNATFYDSNDEILFSDNNLGIEGMGVILPGSKAPFIIGVDLYASDVDHYSFDINFQEVEAIPVGLELISSNQSVDENEKLTVAGEITNTGGYTAKSPLIYVTFYDSEGTVVNVRSGSTNPQDIESNQTASFAIDSPWAFGSQNDLVESYAITAVCDQFVLIHEYSSVVFIPLFMILTLLVLIVYRKKLRN